jgi:alpha-1,6-mannosyltransferase
VNAQLARGARPEALLFATVLAIELVFVHLASSHGQFARAGEPLRFVVFILLAGMAFLQAVRRFAAIDERVQRRTLWGFAIALRLAMLNCVPGDDFWRYVWEGRAQNAGHNPYLHSPAAPELQRLRDENWLRINHPDVAAIYPPAAELTFAALTRVSSSPYWFKLVFIAADLLTLALLLRLVSIPAAAWYAWNPAVVHAFAGAAHYDSLMLVPLTAAILALHRAGSNAGSAFKWQTLSAGCLGLAIALKLVPVFFLPVWGFALGRRAWLLVISLALPTALALLFGGVGTVLQPVRAFADLTRFNELFAWIFPNPWQRNWPVTLLLSVTILIIAWYWRHDWQRNALWVFGGALILSPVLHPWYVTWILPLAVWRQQSAWTVLSISVLSAFLLWDTTTLWNAWQPNLLTRAFVILPPLFTWWRETKGSAPAKSRA